MRAEADIGRTRLEAKAGWELWGTPEPWDREPNVHSVVFSHPLGCAL